MIRQLFFLILIVAVVWVTFQPGAPSLQLPFHLPSSSAPLDEDRASLRMLERRVLSPLGQKDVNSTPSAPSPDLHSIQVKLAKYRTEPAYPQLAQAASLLQQAMDDRSKFAQQLKNGSPEERLDHIPGQWHIVGHPNQTFDPGARNRSARTNFFGQAILRAWDSRAAWYRPAIDRLLVPPPPQPISAAKR